MADREKLIELLTDDIPHCDNELKYVDDERVERLADHLIANGVTIQRWIPVTERLPERYHAVIVWTRYRELGEAIYDGKHFRWDCDEDCADVTHWMPLPEPPKGE